jgi:lysophospholipase L1-like esterase
MKRPRIITILVIVISVLVLLELVLFVSGRALLLARRQGAPVLSGRVIACFGDSHTFGVGTSGRYSYPKQLEVLLNENNPGSTPVVLNFGVPGSSTKRQVEEMALFFKQNNAALVLWLTGRNNQEQIKLFKNGARNTTASYDPKIIKLLRAVWARLSGMSATDDRGSCQNALYRDYMRPYLDQALALCDRKGAKLVLLSYYNTSDNVIREFAREHKLSYIELKPAFDILFRLEDRKKYISADASHMDHKGYQFFSEELYHELFLNQDRLGLKLNPLVHKIPGGEFYADAKEADEAVRLQKERVARYKDRWEYPYELIQLGHIYMELGRRRDAKECYLNGLRSSHYLDNNMVVAPIINWYIENGERLVAAKMCDEVLEHNPQNSVARYYRGWIANNL